MRNPSPLRLVKDFIDYRIVYYWIDPHNNRASNTFETIELAREWFINYQFESFPGPERRKSRIDRRRSNKYASSSRSAGRLGRRVTDQPVKVAIDRSNEKIQILRTTMTKQKGVIH